MEPSKIPTETAESLMLTPFTAQQDTLAGSLFGNKQTDNVADTYDYIYVLDSNGMLVGVVSLSNLFRAPDDKPLQDLMDTDLVFVKPETDQEQVALLALRHGFKSIPVVEDGRLKGAVPAHEILRIFHDEHVEDLLKEAGVVHRSLGKNINILRQIKARLPWLLYGVLGGMLAAVIVTYFESALEEQILLAAFIPVIVYLADAVGNQVQTIYVRAYAFGLSRRLSMSLSREMAITASLALFISTVMAAIIWLWFGQVALVVIVACAAALSIMFAGIVALVMPWLFIKLGYDPAVSSGPLSTILLDISSIVIYFYIAEYLLVYFQ